jgi:deazaflavin-dependent oxidoreductase (nitroreductase family)
MAVIRYKRPSRLYTTFYRLVNPIFKFVVRHTGNQNADGQDALCILRVQGRQSGKLYDTPVRLAIFQSERYIVSLLGDSQWSRNLRALGTAQLVAGNKVEAISARELLGDDKLAFMSWYIQDPIYTSRMQPSTKLTPQEIATLYPVFHVQQLKA